MTGAELERARERWGTERDVPTGSENRAREKGRLLLDRGRLGWWKEAGQRAPRDRQEPCGQKDGVTDGWEVDLRKGGGGRCKEEEETREQAERQQMDRERERKYKQTEKRKEKGRHSETDGQTETSRHTQKDKKDVDRERQVDRGGMEKPGPPKPGGHPWMEQKVVHGGEGGPRTGWQCELAGGPD